jgi:hypothetical protein
MSSLPVNALEVNEPPQDDRDLRRLIATIESLALSDERKAAIGRELLAKLRPHLPPPPHQHRHAA